MSWSEATRLTAAPAAELLLESRQLTLWLCAHFLPNR